MEVTVKQGMISVFSMKFDLCSAKRKPDLLKISMAMIGLPSKCPISKDSVFCMDVSKPYVKLTDMSVKFLEMFQKSSSKEATIRINITHDTGFSCFESDHRIIIKN